MRVVSVAVVNGLLARSTSFDTLVAGLRAQTAAISALARTALAGRHVPDDASCIRIGTAALALATEATYAATELPDGPARSAGARSAIALPDTVQLSAGMTATITVGPRASASAFHGVISRVVSQVPN